MNNQSISGLVQLGLSEKEAQLYMAALKSGPTTAQILALESGIKRATVYGYIDALIDKGLLHIEIKGVRKLFIAEAPDKLTALLDQKKKILTNILPVLMQAYLHSAPTSNTIKMYQGISGIKLVYDDILATLKPGDEYLVISDQKKWHALDPDYFEEFILKRAALKPIVKLILQYNGKELLKKPSRVQKREQTKFLPKSIKLNINMVIYAQRVLMVQTVKPFMAILIENQNVAEMNKVLFNTIWELL